MSTISDLSKAGQRDYTVKLKDFHDYLHVLCLDHPRLFNVVPHLRDPSQARYKEPTRWTEF